MTLTLHDATKALVEKLGLEERDIAPHLRAALEKLSPEHPSGIALSQLETPMMKQFRAVKEEVPDGLLFFRMGDFFELFGADAIIAADVCGLTLTSRDRNSDNPVPMAGVPAVAYRQSVKKCVLAGYKVVVCDQVEDPRQAKGIVKREIVRIASPAVPGDIDDEEVVSEGCYLAAIKSTKQGFVLGFVDASTGEFRLTSKLSREALLQELLTINPKEILTKADENEELTLLVREALGRSTRTTATEAWVFRSEQACRELFAEFFKPRDLERFGVSQVEFGVQVVASLLSYLKATQRDVLRNLREIEYYELSDCLLIDDSTKRHLDFFVTSSGERKGSLFWFLNQCLTASGSRALLRRLHYPFKHREQVIAAHDEVAEFFEDTALLREVDDLLRQCADVERLLARTAQKSIDPRGLSWLRATLRLLPLLEAQFEKSSLSRQWKARATQWKPHFDRLAKLRDLLNSALCEEPAAVLGKGPVFAKAFSAELDELVELETGLDAKLAELEASEREKTQISTLKIGYTRVFGYYFEISKGKLSQAPKHFIRKQTIANGERFITPELKEIEDKALTAIEKKEVLERELFEKLRNDVLGFGDDLIATAHALAHVDLAATFARLARTHNWCRPEVVDFNVTALQKSVHPVMKAFSSSREPFVANNIALGELSKLPATHFARAERDSKILLITGPNMAGKSTVMRQCAVAQVMSQIGCYVPAVQATLGVCDRIFTRIGSSDFSLKNQSTFMVEMLEAAHMLRLATPQSLLLMDEIGRGTSTYDGLSIAWAILEDLHDRLHARTLFSTHYHELQAVAQSRPEIAARRMEVIETDGDNKQIVFTRRFLAGAAEKSYGIHVAELAGLPPELIARAREVLESLGEARASESVAPVQKAETAKPEPQSVTPALPFTSDALRDLCEVILSQSADELSPRDALEVVYALQEKVRAMREGRPELGAQRGKRRRVDANVKTMFEI